MNYRIEICDDLLMVLDQENNGHEAYEVDPDQPWDAARALLECAGQYDLDPVAALGELRRYLKDCR